MTRDANASDLRRDAAVRLHRAKIAMTAACAAITVTVWALVASSIAPTAAASVTPATTSIISAPRDDGFFAPAPNLVDGGRRAPLLRSQGS
jgi:hypothetical protein